MQLTVSTISRRYDGIGNVIMNKELTIKTQDQAYNVYLQPGFFSYDPPTAAIHHHYYSEIHLLSHGSCEFVVEGKSYLLDGEHGLIIPKKLGHCCTSITPGAKHIAFQIDRDCPSVSGFGVGGEVGRLFADEIKLCNHSEDFGTILCLVEFVCHKAFQTPKTEARNISDYSFLIDEYLIRNYNRDIHLCDLAATLHVSERHAERLLLKHTGKNFKQSLLDIRASVAKGLIDKGTMPLAEIAGYVGYRSYCGFWKAMKKSGIF